MPMMYNPEDLKNFIKEEQAQSNAKENGLNKEEVKKAKDLANKAIANASVAFEQAQNNRFEIEILKKQVKTAKIIAIIAIIIAVICMAMTMIDELNSLIAILP